MKRTTFLCLAALLIATALPAAAQKFKPKTIQFKGATAYSDQELMAAADLKPGVVLSSAEMNDHAKRLMDSGVFDNITFKFDGLDLIFSLIPNATLFPLRLENIPLATGPELDAKLHDRLPLYHGKVPSDGGLLDDVKAALTDMLAAQGIKATIAATPYIDSARPAVTAINLAITDLPVRVGKIQLDGISPAIRSKVEDIARHAVSTAYSTENSAGNLERALAVFYGDEGYAAVRIHATQAGNPEAGEEAITVPFRVAIEEGKHYTLGAIRLPSGEQLNLAEINKAAGTATNKVEVAMSIKGGLTLRTALLYVNGQYKSKGYMDCVVTPHPEFDDAAGIVNYTLEVKPGQVYVMGKLKIMNTADDLRDAMIAAWKLPAGAVFDESAIQTYYHSQGNTPLGRTFATANCRYKLTRYGDTGTVDVELRLERKE
jgi:outer membrane protein insertion porin family